MFKVPLKAPIKQTAGNTLMIVLVSLAFLAALSTTIIGIVRWTSSNTKTYRSELEFQNLIDQVKVYLNDADYCSQALKDQPFNALLSPGTPMNVILNIPSYNGAPGPIAPGWQPFPGLTVGDVQIVRQSNRVRYVHLAKPGGLHEKFLASILLFPRDFSWSHKRRARSATGINVSGQTIFEIGIPIYVKVRNGVIKSCHGTSSTAEACELVRGGAYDPDESDPRLSCNPDLNCFRHNPYEMASPASCPAPFTARPYGQPYGSFRYFCEWCNKKQ